MSSSYAQKTTAKIGMREVMNKLHNDEDFLSMKGGNRYDL